MLEVSFTVKIFRLDVAHIVLARPHQNQVCWEILIFLHHYNIPHNYFAPTDLLPGANAIRNPPHLGLALILHSIRSPSAPVLKKIFSAADRDDEKQWWQVSRLTSGN